MSSGLPACMLLYYSGICRRFWIYFNIIAVVSMYIWIRLCGRTFLAVVSMYIWIRFCGRTFSRFLVSTIFIVRGRLCLYL
jgi:hypothetical protein